jgi:hypothetical protein
MTKAGGIKGQTISCSMCDFREGRIINQGTTRFIQPLRLWAIDKGWRRDKAHGWKCPWCSGALAERLDALGDQSGRFDETVDRTVPKG